MEYALLRQFSISLFCSLTICISSVVAAELQPTSMGYVLQADHLAKTQDEAAKLLSESGRDLIVIDAAYDGTSRWSSSQIETIRNAKDERRVVCYLSIGEAEDYRSYWKSEWDADRDGTPDSLAPKFLHGENPDWEGNYKVKYWMTAWQSIILEEVDRIVKQGFDGVYLDIVDAFEFFEYNEATDEWIDNRVNPETTNTYREDMVRWVSRIREKLNTTERTHLVIPQNGEALLEFDSYLGAIDAIGVEDLFTRGKRPKKESQIEYRSSFLMSATRANKPVFVIEYTKSQQTKTFAIDSAMKAGYSLLITDRSLKTLGEATNP